MKALVAIALTFALLLIPERSLAKCEICHETCEPELMEMHTFEDEYDHGIETYDLEICPCCVMNIK